MNRFHSRESRQVIRRGAASVDRSIRSLETWDSYATPVISAALSRPPRSSSTRRFSRASTCGLVANAPGPASAVAQPDATVSPPTTADPARRGNIVSHEGSVGEHAADAVPSLWLDAGAAPNA